MDRQDITLVSLWLHVPFITAWIGLVMFDVFATLAPGFNAVQRARILGWSRLFVLVAIPIILVTGVWQTIENPFFRVDAYSKLSELRERTLYGDLLFWKHAFVLGTFAMTILVRFILAPRLLAESDPAGDSLAASTVSAAGTATMTQARSSTLRWAQLASLANLAFCLGAVLLATRMVVELH